MSAEHNITIDQGATNWVVFTVYSDAAQTTPLNLAGYTAASMSRPNVNSGVKWFDLNTENGGIDLGAFVDGGGLYTLGPLSNGGIGLVFDDEASTAIAFRDEAAEGVYDVELYPPAGEPIKIAHGTITINREVTR